MPVADLAAGVAAELAGRLLFLVGLPVTGLILLIIGLRKRSRHLRRPVFPPPGRYPPGYPGYPYQQPYQPYQQPHQPYHHPYQQPIPQQGHPARLPPQPPRGSSGTALIIVGTVLLVLGLASFLARFAEAATHSAASLRVGQCITGSDYESSSLAKPKDCGRPDAIFELAAKGRPSATCPDGKRDGTRYTTLRNSSTTLCFIPNLQEGQCFSAAANQPDTGSATSCENPSNSVEVVKRVDDSVDTTECPAGSKAITYPSPPRLYCITRAGG